MPREIDVPVLVAAMRDGDRRALARLLTCVENGHPKLAELGGAVAAHTGHAQIVGLTGPPGVGKSTTTNALVAAYRAAGSSVAVLAVDPSSPFSGGALLGDRIRMVGHASDQGVYVRSMATRGHLGGLSAAAPASLRVLDAAGFDIVLVETVGVGQSEVHIAGLADTTIVLLAPGMGDSIQAAKAGVLEIGDLFVVNKADRDGAAATVRDLRHMISLGQSGEPGQWRPEVMQTVAERGEGLDEVTQAVAAHRAWMVEHDELSLRRRRRASDEIEELVIAQLRRRMADPRDGADLTRLAQSVADGRLDPYTAADALVDAMESA